MATSVFQLIECKFCGKTVPAGTYCGECGKPLYKETGYRNITNCPSCKRKVAEGKFCASCGNPLPQQILPAETDCVIELIKSDFFEFTEQEKNVLRFFFSKKCNDEGSRIYYEASLSDIYTLFEIFDDDVDTRFAKFESLIKHSFVELKTGKKLHCFNFIDSVAMNRQENKARIKFTKKNMEFLNEIYQSKHFC